MRRDDGVLSRRREGGERWLAAAAAVTSQCSSAKSGVRSPMLKSPKRCRLVLATRTLQRCFRRSDERQARERPSYERAKETEIGKRGDCRRRVSATGNKEEDGQVTPRSISRYARQGGEPVSMRRLSIPVGRPKRCEPRRSAGGSLLTAVAGWAWRSVVSFCSLLNRPNLGGRDRLKASHCCWWRWWIPHGRLSPEDAVVIMVMPLCKTARTFASPVRGATRPLHRQSDFAVLVRAIYTPVPRPRVQFYRRLCPLFSSAIHAIQHAEGSPRPLVLRL